MFTVCVHCSQNVKGISRVHMEAMCTNMNTHTHTYDWSEMGVGLHVDLHVDVDVEVSSSLLSSLLSVMFLV